MSAPDLRFPAEWEPQSAVLIAWPHAGTDWAARLAEVEATYVALVAAITRFQPVVIVVADAALQAHAAARLADADVDSAQIRFVHAPYDDTWLRDSGPITLAWSGTGHPATARTAPVRHGSEPERDESADADSRPAHPCAGNSWSGTGHPAAARTAPVRHGSEPERDGFPSPRPRGEGGRRPDEGQAFHLLDFRFTGWGGKFEAGADDRLIERLFDQRLFLNNSRQLIDFALEGGAIETDGEGCLLTTWRCLHERHPAASRDELTAKLAAWLHQDRVLWLDHGALEGDDTDAHIDTLARFAAPDAIVFQACDDPADSHFADLRAMADEIAALRTRDGTPYRLFPLPWARPVLDEGRRLAASYANFLIINGAVLMPAYDDPADAAAAAVLAQAFPSRDIVPVPCRPLIWQNGSLHCITMQLPQGLVESDLQA
ncbi:agmatine deiminase family protein [Thermomonas sp.]|uniref:agmatine deiminase family protein n=1 Tax=Thermomonas sp. TaxID=1971895 RepID=UPI00261603DE|nr:agmatine deiminase family protein [Thermomonas sp.]